MSYFSIDFYCFLREGEHPNPGTARWRPLQRLLLPVIAQHSDRAKGNALEPMAMKLTVDWLRQQAQTSSDQRLLLSPD